jgi:putative membrane protein
MKGDTKYKIFLLVVFLAVWIWAAINPIYPHAWLIENYLVFFFIPVIILTGFYFRLSNTSYTLITMFMILHVIGSHYTYAEVPFGYFIQEFLGSSRNMYDRLVHFAFGLLLFYPIREMFMRLSQTKGAWSFWFPIELTFALAAIYEIIEWIAAVTIDPAAGLAFVGSQGDIWDAQKDMLLAGLGATIAAITVFFIRFRYDKNLWKEFKDSLKPSTHDEVLGEVKLRKLRDKSQK